MVEGLYFDEIPEETELEEDKKFCETQYCYQIIWRWDEHCEHCQLTRYSEIYTERCHAPCWRRALKTSGYCDKHNKKCLSCDSRDIVDSNKCYCSDHASSCLDCSARTPLGKIYCEVHQKEENLKSLIRQKTSLSNSQEFTRFETWWSNNLVTVIDYNGGYWVYLLVYVKENNVVKVFPESHNCSCWGDSGKGRKNHSVLSEAQSEAGWLREQLTSSGKYYDHPILLIHPACDCYRSFNDFVTSPYVWKEEIGRSFCFDRFLIIVISGYQTPSNLDDYFKPLDIIKVKKINHIVGKTYLHVGIYLDKNAICHISDPNGLISEENLQVRITGWDAFLNGWLGTPISGRAGELIRYRPIIPFKHYKKSIEQAVKAWYKDYGSGKYDLFNDNCEHFANAIIYGVYYSEQAESAGASGAIVAKVWDEVWTKNFNFVCKIFQPNHWGTIWRDAPILRYFDSNKYRANNRLLGESTNICLKNEIYSWDSNGKFDNLTSNELRDKRDEYERQYLIEVPAKQECRIM